MASTGRGTGVSTRAGKGKGKGKGKEPYWLVHVTPCRNHNAGGCDHELVRYGRTGGMRGVGTHTGLGLRGCVGTRVPRAQSLRARTAWQPGWLAWQPGWLAWQPGWLAGLAAWLAGWLAWRRVLRAAQGSVP